MAARPRIRHLSETRQVPGAREDGFVSDEGAPREIPPDYDHDPARFRMACSVLRQHGLVPDIHASVAERFISERLLPVLDIGCGEGELAKHLPEDSWVGVDNSAEMLMRAPQPKLLAAATALPYPDESIAFVALLYVLYHLARPEHALAEAHRVLRRRGLVAVATPSRHDSPELAHYLPSLPLTFDAERAAELVAAYFDDVEIETWDGLVVDFSHFTTHGTADTRAVRSTCKGHACSSLFSVRSSG
jgi:SAM-dependent methyltransferase